jgi:diguanylate cyclase (GGDEF)-like protein
MAYTNISDLLSHIEISAIKENQIAKLVWLLNDKQDNEKINQYQIDFVQNMISFNTNETIAIKKLKTLTEEHNELNVFIKKLEQCDDIHKKSSEEYLTQINNHKINQKKLDYSLTKIDNALTTCTGELLQDFETASRKQFSQDLHEAQLVYKAKKIDIFATTTALILLTVALSFLIIKQLFKKRLVYTEHKKLIKIQELYNFTNSINYSNNISEIINVSTKTIKKILNTELISISIKENNEKTYQTKIWEPSALPEEFIKKVNDFFLWKTNTTKPKQILISSKEIQEHLPNIEHTLKEFNIQNIFFTPLTVKQKIIGNYIAYYTYQKNEITEEELQLSASIAFHISFSLDKKEQEENIYTLAYYDPLTNLPNRRLLHEKAKKRISRISKHKTFGAFIFIDLDNFKKVNDSLGHDAGDILLTKVAKKIKEAIRDSDMVARMGGDEFVVLLDSIGDSMTEAIKNAHGVALKIKNLVSIPLEIREKEIMVTASIGISLFGHQNDRYEDIMKQADIAMYQSKDSGKNMVKFYNNEVQKIIDDKFVLEQDLQKAIKLNQFKLFYQPQISLNKNTVSVEALIRWEHPTLGLVPPLNFIPLAEDNGTIHEIGEWVFKTACLQIKKFNSIYPHKKIIIAVNVSPKQFTERTFINNVKNIIQEIGINPELLKVELTESSIFHNIEESIEKMQELKQIGIGISLDDFGTGYSSLSYLTKLPLTEIKIDKVFTQNILNEKNSTKSIVEAIIYLANSLNLDIVAEGIETEEQYNALLSMGCSTFQGYLFGKPEPHIQEIKTL